MNGTSSTRPTGAFTSSLGGQDLSAWSHRFRLQVSAQTPIRRAHHVSHVAAHHDDPATAQHVQYAAKVLGITREPVQVFHDHQINAAFGRSGQDFQHSRAIQVEGGPATVRPPTSSLSRPRAEHRS